MRPQSARLRHVGYPLASLSLLGVLLFLGDPGAEKKMHKEDRHRTAANAQSQNV